MASIRSPALFQNRGRSARALAIALFFGALSGYGQPGIRLAPLMPLGLVVFSFLAARSRSAWEAARIGVAFGFGILAVITVSARDWAFVVPVALTLFGITMWALPRALWVYFLKRRELGTSAFLATVAFISLWMDLSDALSFPTKGEGLITIAAAPMLMSGARLFGSNVATGILAAGTIGCGLELARLTTLSRRGVWLAARPVLASLVLLLSASALAHLTAPGSTGKLSVGVPQTNVPAEYFTRRQELPQLNDAFDEVFSKQVNDLSGVDLLALTETYDGAYPLLAPRVRQRFQNHARLEHQAVLLSSYLTAEDGGIYNALGGIDADGELVGVHRKVNLAPFGEVEYEAGTSFDPMPMLPGVSVGALICQEALLGEGPRTLTLRGASVLITSTSDISFGSGILTFEHLAGAQLEALETGRSMVWASAGGPSGSIDRWGAFEATAPFRAPGAARMTIDLHRDLPLFLRFRWLWPALAIGCLALFGSRLKTVSLAAVPSRPLGTLRGTIEAGFAFCFVVLASIGSPAVVEIANGTRQRARQSVVDLLRGPSDHFGPGSLARFQTDVSHSASGALAYYLDYYGQRALPESLQLTAAPKSLVELAKALERSAGFPVREIPLDFAELPHSATLVQANSGEYCVTMSDRAKGIWVFAPTGADIRELSVAEAKAQLKPVGLAPATLHK